MKATLFTEVVEPILFGTLKACCGLSWRFKESWCLSIAPSLDTEEYLLKSHMEFIAVSTTLMMLRQCSLHHALFPLEHKKENFLILLSMRYYSWVSLLWACGFCELFKSYISLFDWTAGSSKPNLQSGFHECAGRMVCILCKLIPTSIPRMGGIPSALGALSPLKFPLLH